MAQDLLWESQRQGRACHSPPADGQRDLPETATQRPDVSHRGGDPAPPWPVRTVVTTTKSNPLNCYEVWTTCQNVHFLCQNVHFLRQRAGRGVGQPLA